MNTYIWYRPGCQPRYYFTGMKELQNAHRIAQERYESYRVAMGELAYSTLIAKQNVAHIQGKFVEARPKITSVSGISPEDREQALSTRFYDI